MTARDNFDGRLADWMTETAYGRPQAGRLEQAMEATARRRPRPRWLAGFGNDWVGTTAHRPILPAWPGLPLKLVLAAMVALLLVATIVAAALVGAQLLRPDRAVETPSPEPLATVPGLSTYLVGPGGDPAVEGALMAPGVYEYLDVDRQGFNIRFTVPSGWTWNGRYLSKGGVDPPNGATIFFFGGPVDVYADPCHWAGAQSSPQSGLAPNDLVAALAAQPTRGATTPIARPAMRPGVPNSMAGMSIALTVPAELNLAACDGGQFRSWGPDSNARIHQGPGQRDLVWAVDAGGPMTRSGVFLGGLIVDAASFPGTPTDVTSEIDAILGSFEIGSWG